MPQISRTKFTNRIVAINLSKNRNNHLCESVKSVVIKNNHYKFWLKPLGDNHKR